MDVFTNDNSRMKEMCSRGELPSPGRKRKDVDKNELMFVKKNMESGIMTSNAAAKRLGIGRTTLFGWLAELKE